MNSRCSPAGTHQAHEKPSFLVLLYGTLEYDGRAQRMVEILRGLGSVIVVDIADQEANQIDWAANVRQISVYLPKQANKISKHLRCGWTALQVARIMRPSAVVAENYFTTLPGWLSARLCKAKLVYDAYELIIPEPGESMSWRDRFWYWMERLAIRRADLVVAANEERAQLMQAHYRLVRTPVVMRNIPPRRESTKDIQRIVTRYPQLARRSVEDRLLLYQGNIDLSRGIDRFMLALAHLPAEYRMVVVGEGPDLERLRAIGQPFEGEGRFDAIGRVAHHLLPAITAMADVGIVTYPFQGLNNIYCAPNKLFEYALSGLPVVATNQPPLRRLVESYGIGKLVREHDTPEQIAGLIKEAAENKAEYTKALARFLEDHRWEDEAERVRAAIARILNKSRCTA